MIELLLQAERSLSVGQLDAAEKLYWQAIENDPRNSIAVVGLARVALDRGDDRTAYQFARKALEIDGENPAARRLVDRLGELMAYRGETPPTEATPPLRRPIPAALAAAPAPVSDSAPSSVAAPAPVSATAPASATPPSSAPAKPSARAKPKRGLIGRILGRG